jgi:hypothetical protein
VKHFEYGDVVKTRRALDGIAQGAFGRVIGLTDRDVQVQFPHDHVWVRRERVQPACELCGADIAKTGDLCCDCHVFGMGGAS